MTPVAKRRRSGGPPLRYDWQRIEGGTYRASPDSTFRLYAWRSGGSWRWSVNVNDPTTRFPIWDGVAPTLIRAKHAAENWYHEHGGKGQPTIWETISEPSEVPDDGIS